MKRRRGEDPGAIAGPLTSAELQKRQEIICGARRVFFDMGFDGASMNEIARVSNVSKATIYSYFASKEDLFVQLVYVDRYKAAERLFDYDPSDLDIVRLLRQIGETFMLIMVESDHIRLTRLVIGAAEKFPEVGRAFFEAGPREGSRRLAGLLAQLTDLGYLTVTDPEAAAYQFFNLCQGDLVKKLMLGVEHELVEASVTTAVADAVDVFLSAYGSKRGFKTCTDAP